MTQKEKSNIHNQDISSKSSQPGVKTNVSGIKPERIVELPAFRLAGISAVTTNEAELSGAGKIGPLFERYYSENIGGELAAHQEQPGNYNCYFNYESDHNGQYEVLVGVKVNEPWQMEGDDAVQSIQSIQAIVVPPAKYAVFVTERGPIIEMVQRAWGGIWQWSQQPGNERTYSGDFEYYAPDIDPNDGQARIYIAIS